MTCSKKRSSPVWEFFEEPMVVEEREDGVVVKKISCKLCDMNLADGGGTSNLHSKHPSEYKCITEDDSSSLMKQSTLSGVFKKCSAQHSAAITDSIADFAALDLRPISIVNGKGFKNFMKFVEPGYRVPSHTHVTSICRKKFLSLKENLLATLSQQYH